MVSLLELPLELIDNIEQYFDTDIQFALIRTCKFYRSRILRKNKHLEHFLRFLHRNCYRPYFIWHEMDIRINRKQTFFTKSEIPNAQMFTALQSSKYFWKIYNTFRKIGKMIELQEMHKRSTSKHYCNPKNHGLFKRL